MISKNRVLAALERRPVDRIPFCDHMSDINVALSAAGYKKSSLIKMMIKTIGIKELPKLLKLLAASGNLKKMANPEVVKTGLSLMSNMDHIVSGLIGKDNITYHSSFACFDNGSPYMLNPEQLDKGMSADGLIKTWDDIDKMKFRDIGEVVEGAKKFLKKKGDFAACALIYLGIDPTWHTMGFETFCIACMEEPELIREILGRITDWYAKVAQEMCELDFDFIWAADDIAYNTAPMFSPKLFRELLLPYTRKVAQKITKPWIYHSDGNLLPIWDDLTSQGMNAIHPLEAGSMDLEYLTNTYRDKITFVGGVDLCVLESGTTEQTKQITEDILKVMEGSSYIFGPSNSVTPNVIPDNLKIMLETLNRYNDAR